MGFGGDLGDFRTEGFVFSLDLAYFGMNFLLNFSQILKIPLLLLTIPLNPFYFVPHTPTSPNCPQNLASHPHLLPINIAPLSINFPQLVQIASTKSPNLHTQLTHLFL